jgi:hypothetical protein
MAGVAPPAVARHLAGAVGGGDKPRPRASPLASPLTLRRLAPPSPRRFPLDRALPSPSATRSRGHRRPSTSPPCRRSSPSSSASSCASSRSRGALACPDRSRRLPRAAAAIRRLRPPPPRPRARFDRLHVAVSLSSLPSSLSLAR